MANVYSGSDPKNKLRVREVDGTPNVFPVSTIIVSNGTLTDNGGGQVTLTTGGGGGGSGTVTSVAVSGGTTGITVSGSPITTSGTITLGGTLAIANGGTGATTAAAAATALGVGTTSNVQFNNVEIDGILNHDGTQIGFFGVATAIQQPTSSSTLNPIPYDPVGGSQLDAATASEIDTNLASLQTAQQAILDLLTTYGLSS